MDSDRLYLGHIRDCIRRIGEYTVGGRAAFMASPLHQDAVIRNFEIIGEAAKRLSDTVTADQSVPWRRIAAFRNFLIHQYMGVDLVAVWNVVENDLPALDAHVENLLTP